MYFTSKLEQAVLICRYKRFLADVRLTDGSTLTIHCPNSGSMRSCSEPGSLVYFSQSGNPKRKYPHTLEMILAGATWVGINTSRTNTIVAEAILNKEIAEIIEFDELKREVKTSEGSRLDIMLTAGAHKTYIEVKNCSLVDDGYALFPDAITARGTKHLNELIRLVKDGHTGIIFYLIQRLDADRFRPAADIDPLYAETLRTAANQGVLVIAYQAAVTPESINVVKRVPVILD
ncbi:MAG: DNA/RNA nuclease SfsA [Deltaproteobacteria bacterium]|nr:DNA/RNA nuclease SfsA [Deltaproteobacteria bacterium]MBT8359779.1 DNA/RNA nuclease SfsA [Deltaproteobacteria bacterium]